MVKKKKIGVSEETSGRVCYVYGPCLTDVEVLTVSETLPETRKPRFEEIRPCRGLFRDFNVCDEERGLSVERTGEEGHEKDLEVFSLRHDLNSRR